jgi:hypothetical protein
MQLLPALKVCFAVLDSESKHIAIAVKEVLVRHATSLKPEQEVTAKLM